ncbi:MAG: hypothetical protein K6A95_00060 [Bacteroidales bacterium]|nr:hypothetical protein [Bacteroidales bacterium]
MKHLLPRLALLLLTLLWQCPLEVAAQHDAPLRLELTAAKDQDDYHFALADTNGALVLYDAGLISADTTRWVFIHYDTNLVKKSHFEISLPAQTDYVASHTDNGVIHLLMAKTLPKKDAPRTFVVSVDLRENRHTVLDLSSLESRELSGICTAGEQWVLFASNSKKDEIYFFDQQKNHLTLLNDIGDYKVQFCLPDTANHRWLLGLNPSIDGTPGHLFLYEQDWQSGEGTVIALPRTLTDGTGLLLHTARAFVVNADTVLLAGTYNIASDKQVNNLHSGVFALVLSHQTMDTLMLYSFTALKNGSGKSSNINLQLQLGLSATDGEQFTISSEVYYPEYSYSYSYQGYYDDLRYGTSSPTAVFTGYRFVNAYVTTFDRHGNLLWDNYFLLDDISIMTLAPVLRVAYIGSDALLCYSRNNRIYSSLLNQGQTVEKPANISIETSNPREVVEYNKQTQIQRWYGDNFVASGYQYLRNRDRATKAKRYVFYLNKLIYQ